MVVRVPPNRSATLTTGVTKGQADPAYAPATTARTVAHAAQLACVLEVSAEKPGNITPSHDFGDTTFEDMLRCAIAIGPELVVERGVGETVLAVVENSPAPANANLGIALLLAPLAKAALAGGPLRERLRAVLRDLGDARAAYAAIRLAGAGGLDERVEHDVREEPSIGLREAMAAAAERDSIASEYVTDFALTFEVGLTALRDLTREAIVELHLRLLAHKPDTLIARKAGVDAAEQVSAGAREVLAGRRTLESFDASLRTEGNQLNPGTTADVVTATIFVALVEGMLAPSHHSS
jgi:triphosphoribosyl-dephospho-CoA synthase